MVKVPYEKALAEVVQYDNSDVIQTGWSGCTGPGILCGIFGKAGILSGTDDKPVID